MLALHYHEIVTVFDFDMFEMFESSYWFCTISILTLSDADLSQPLAGFARQRLAAEDFFSGGPEKTPLGDENRMMLRVYDVHVLHFYST